MYASKIIYVLKLKQHQQIEFTDQLDETINWIIPSVQPLVGLIIHDVSQPIQSRAVLGNAALTMPDML